MEARYTLATEQDWVKKLGVLTPQDAIRSIG
jgi:hypothetical protein